MELKLGYQELLELIRQLPASQLAKLKKDLSEDNFNKKPNSEMSEFQKFLLTAPIWTKENEESFKENRKHFNSWKIK